jgi:hypothetical protein
LVGRLQVERDPVSQLDRALDILERGARDELEVDVAGVAFLQPQPLDRREHLFHGGVGVGHDPRGEEQPVDAPLLFERDKGGGQLVGLEGDALAADGARRKAVFAKILVTLQSPDCSRSMHACALLRSIARMFVDARRVAWLPSLRTPHLSKQSAVEARGRIR